MLLFQSSKSPLQNRLKRVSIDRTIEVISRAKCEWPKKESSHFRDKFSVVKIELAVPYFLKAPLSQEFGFGYIVENDRPKISFKIIKSWDYFMGKLCF